MKPAGLKITKPRNSTDHRSGLSLSVARGNSYQVWWAPDTFGLIRKKEETLALNREENAPQEHGKTVDFKPADLRGFRNDADTAPSASPASPASPAHRGPDSGSLFGAGHAGSPPRPGLGRPTLAASDLGSRNPSSNPDSNLDRNSCQRLPRNPRLARRGGVWHLLMVEVPCVPSSPFRRSG